MSTTSGRTTTSTGRRARSRAISRGRRACAGCSVRVRTCDPCGDRGRLRAARGQAGYSRFPAGLNEPGLFSRRTLEGIWLS
jgi:hypothetical protein